MTRRPRIAVIGSANVDLTTFSDRFPRAGETIFGQHFDLGWGGKGANQAVAARLCGADVSMIARVGDDLFGPATIANFNAQGIDASHVHVVPGVSSGVAPIFVESNGQNRIIVVKGANDRLRPADVDAAAPMLAVADCIVLQFEIPLDTVFHAVRFARRHGIRCIVNPAPAQAFELRELEGVDYFVPNETEAEAISGMPVRTIEDATACAVHMVSQGLTRVIITLGANGALLATADGATHIPPFPVDARDTTGAGDAFVGSFAVYLGEGLSEPEAIARANLYAALSTTGIGSQKSFVTRQRADEEWTARAAPPHA
ncbi:MAG: ribokinase [Acidobacteria bacterium]|nr:ribokinase [Acidobacteriota bacterium]